MSTLFFMAEREVRFEPFVRKERSDADAAAQRRRPEGVSAANQSRSISPLPSQGDPQPFFMAERED
ncbi:MAG: hypothetical protein JAY97_19775 [Candidatus Thiodiazotropha sp. 'RUGA']|nr:hypothetical protein [Candidatus Thiodiazotropha sp. 'RUGA']